MARSRLPPAVLTDSGPAQDAARTIRDSRGTVSPLYELLLHSPPMALGWERLLSAVRRESGLPATLRELIILRVAVLNDAPYEFQAHEAIAREAGVTEAQLAQVKTQTRDDFDPLETLALEYCDAMTRHVQVPDALFARVREAFDERSIVELTITIAAYNMVSRFLEALDAH